jgi:hypothetical protein
MPTPAGPETNKFRCESCGRWFNAEGEFRVHQTECSAAEQTGAKPRKHIPAEEEEKSHARKEPE